MEERKKLLCGILSGVVLISIGLIFWEQPNLASSVKNQLGFKSFGALLMAVGIVIIFTVGQDKGKSDYEGKAIGTLKSGKKYKILSITDDLKKCGEYTFLILQEENDKDNIITYARNGCWLPENMKVGSIITQGDRSDIIILE